MFARLTNYLRSYRRQSGLTQSEVAFLLGSHDGAQVSRYERGHHLPPLRTALAYTTIFGVSLGDLFSGIQLGVHKEIMPRIKKLRAQLERKREEHRQIERLHFSQKHLRLRIVHLIPPLCSTAATRQLT